ncbi:hypothetical protein EB354_12545 [Chryseobacterium balustinum]|nr:hypothetical protein EB354_12545 [Chryseobacterium balustinum]
MISFGKGVFGKLNAQNIEAASLQISFFYQDFLCHHKFDSYLVCQFHQARKWQEPVNYFLRH